MIPDASMFAGLRVYKNPHLTIAGEPYVVARNWRERWFTRPWRPLQKEKTVVPQVPDPNVYVSDKNRAVFGHPKTIDALMKEVKRRQL